MEETAKHECIVMGVSAVGDSLIVEATRVAVAGGGWGSPNSPAQRLPGGMRTRSSLTMARQGGANARQLPRFQR
jgi:hypothetical protein